MLEIIFSNFFLFRFFYRIICLHTIIVLNNLHISGFMYSYPMLLIFKQTYLIYLWDSNRYYISKSVDLGVNTMKGYTTLLRIPKLETYHQMQFSILFRKPHFGEWRVLLFSRWGSHHILSSQPGLIETLSHY